MRRIVIAVFLALGVVVAVAAANAHHSAPSDRHTGNDFVQYVPMD